MGVSLRTFVIFCVVILVFAIIVMYLFFGLPHRANISEVRKVTGIYIPPDAQLEMATVHQAAFGTKVYAKLNMSRGSAEVMLRRLPGEHRMNEAYTGEGDGEPHWWHPRPVEKSVVADDSKNLIELIISASRSDERVVYLELSRG